MYGKSCTYEEVLECYCQYAKNQCVATKGLLENLRYALDSDKTTHELSTMMNDRSTL